MALRRFIIEWDIPEASTVAHELHQAAARSNEMLNQLSPDVQWVESFVASDKTFCVYLATDESVIRKYADISGFPAIRITEVSKVIHPTPGQAA